MLAAAFPCTPQAHPRTAPLRLPPSHFVPSQPPQLTANSFQSPYFYRASGLAQIAVSALLRTSSADTRKFSQRSTADTALEIYHQLKCVMLITSEFPTIRSLSTEDMSVGNDFDNG